SSRRSLDAETIAKHRHPIRDLLHFLDTVRDKENADSEGSRVANRVEERFDSGARKIHGWFIENEKASVRSFQLLDCSDDRNHRSLDVSQLVDGRLNSDLK